VDVGDGLLDAAARGGGQEANACRGGHQHPTCRGKALNSLVIGQRGDARPQLLVCALESRAALDCPAHAGAELQNLDLHGHDSSQHHAEDRDPGAAADEPIQQRVVWQSTEGGQGARSEGRG
jgi:hypothetical protein